MTFFPPLPERPAPPEEAEREWRAPAWMEPDRDVIPHIVAVNHVLRRVPGFSLWLPFVEVHPDGILFEFRWTASRGSGGDAAAWQEFQQAIWSHRVAPEAAAERVAVRFSDGRFLDSATAHDAFGREASPESSLVTRSGGSGGSTWSLSGSFSAWLWPRPVDQTFTLGVQWPAAGLAETLVDFPDAHFFTAPASPRGSAPEDPS